MNFLPPFLVFILLSLHASAQADYYVNDTIELTTLGNLDADHAVIAVNRFGDVIVVNHTSVGLNAKAVELNTSIPFGSSLTDGFKLLPTQLLGDPSINIFGIGNDSCAKPDAEALGDDSFLVVWSRHDLSGNQSSRIEACKVITRDSNGNILPQSLIISQQTGEGVIIDDTSTAGEAGFMPDIASFKNSGSTSAIVVFAHEALTNHANINTFREYDLLARKIDWPLGSPLPNLLISTTLETDIPFDNVNTAPYHGGMVLPDAVIDDGGNLAVVYESYIIEPHRAHTGPPRGSIQLRHYSRQSLSLLDETEFVGHNTESHQRRPMIATSNKDSMNILCIGWNDVNVNTTAANRAHFNGILFNSNTSKYSLPRVIPWDESFGREDNLATVAMSARTKLLMASRSFTNSVSLTGAFKSSRQPITYKNFVPNISHPWRPATAVQDLPSNSRSLAYLSFEGPSTNAPSLYSIYLTIQELQ